MTWGPSSEQESDILGERHGCDENFSLGFLGWRSLAAHERERREYNNKERLVDFHMGRRRSFAAK